MQTFWEYETKDQRRVFVQDLNETPAVSIMESPIQN